MMNLCIVISRRKKRKFRDQRTIKQENKGAAKSCETKRLPISADILVDI